jgi:hypothetical protein
MKEVFLRYRDLAARFRDGFLDPLFDFQFRQIHDGGKFRDQQETRPVQHPLFAERQRLNSAQVDEILEDFGDVMDRTRPHFLGVFLEAVFPIFLCEELIAGEEGKEVFNVPPFDNLSKANVPGIRRGHHHQDVIRTYSEEIKLLESTLNQSIGDLLDNPDSMIRVYDLVAYLKCIHANPTEKVKIFYALQGL